MVSNLKFEHVFLQLLIPFKPLTGYSDRTLRMYIHLIQFTLSQVHLEQSVVFLPLKRLEGLRRLSLVNTMTRTGFATGYNTKEGQKNGGHGKSHTGKIPPQSSVIL